MRRMLCAASLLISGIGSAPVADAEPGADPCAGSGIIFCRFLPIAPELEGDIDLTKQAPPVPPDAPPPDAAPPADFCANGCA